MKIAIKIQSYLIILFLFGSLAGIAQNIDWVHAIGSTGVDNGNTMTLDDSGNIYLTGRFVGSVDFGNQGVKSEIRTSVNENTDAYFAKYTPAGKLVFVRVISSIGSDNGVSVKVDKQGNIYVSGVYSGELSFESASQKPLPWIEDNDIFFAKYTPAGAFVFSCRIGGVGNDRLPFFDVDTNENIYLTGTFDNPISFFSSNEVESDKQDGIGKNDLFLAKYDKTGILVFSKQIGGSENDSPAGIKLDSRNNIYIAGNIASSDFDSDPSTTRDKILQSTTNKNDVFIAKYNSNGEYVNAKSMGGADAESPNGMYVDAAGNVYLTGRTDKNADFDPDEIGVSIIGEHNQDIFIAKYFPDLTFDFAKSFGGSDEDLDRGMDIAVDNEGAIYITGEFESPTLNLNPQNKNEVFTNKGAGSGDSFFAKYTSDGTQLLFSLQIGGDGADIGRDIAVDPSGNIYVAGDFENTIKFDANQSFTSKGEKDIFIAKYVPGFTLSKAVATNSIGVTDLHATDLNADGSLDIISANGPETGASSITWYKNDGKGNFTLQPVVADNIQIAKSVFGVDIDGDGDRDILAATRADNRVVWYENKGGSFVKNTPKLISDQLLSPLAVVPADLDGDGDADVVVASRDDGKITWFENRLNEATKDFVLFPVDDAAESAQSVFVVDVDGDGDLDALAAHRRNNGQISWYENTAVDETTRALTLKKEVSLGGAEFVSAADFNMDGTPEIVGVSKNKISIYSIIGGVFGTPKELSGINGGEAVSMADLDGDGDLDIISASFDDNKIAWYENLGNATGNFGAQKIINLTAEGTRIVLTPDLDNDGRSDVLWAAETINKIAWAKNLLFTPTNPTITTFSPASAAPGNTLTIFGTHLGGAAKVFFEHDGTSVEASSVTPDNSGGVEKLIVTIPENLLKGAFKLKINLGGKVVVSIDDFLIPTLPIPQVTELNPSSDTVGAPLTIKGKFFGTDASKVQVKFGSDLVNPFELKSSTEITLQVPDLAPDPYAVSVTVGSAESNKDKEFTIVAPDDPLIDSLSVNAALPGEEITIFGKNFGANEGLLKVFFDEAEIPATNFVLKSDTEIDATIPDLPEGLYNIKVTVNGLASNEVAFTIALPGTPMINTLSAASGAPESKVTLTGQNFGTEAGLVTVAFDETSVDFTLQSETEIEVTVPDLAPGLYKIKVTVDGTSSNEVDFTIAGNGAPALSNITPSIITEGNLPIATLTGTGFGNDPAKITVRFKNASNATTDVTSGINVTGGTEISFTTPALAAGEYTVSVVVDGISSSNTVNFSVQADTGDNPPVITNVPPYAHTEDPIKIAGNNFGTDPNNAKVVFSTTGQSAEGEIVSINNGEIEVDIPGNLPDGDYEVTVKVGDKQTTHNQTLVIDNTPPGIDAAGIAATQYFVPGNAKELTLTATDNKAGISEVKLVYFGIRDEESNAQTASFTHTEADTYVVDIQSISIADELGVAFYLSVIDNAGNAKRFPEENTFFLHKDQQNLTIPATKASNSKEPKVSDYNLVALPLDALTRDQVFGGLGTFGGGANNSWWLFEYNASSQSYTEVSSSSAALAPGKGYMLIFRNTATLQAQGKVLPVTPASPVTISLAPGFNLIGNPFPFNMSWDDVIAFNTGVQDIDQLKFRKFSQGNWGATNNDFKRFEGALVINPTSSAISLEIPFKKADTGGSRYAEDDKKSKPHPLDAIDWEVPLRIETDNRYTLGGIGMDPEAAVSYDPLDDFTVPRFIDFLEMNFSHPEFFLSKFTKDIVPAQETYTWEFEVASNQTSPEVTMHWENYYFGNNGEELMLLDLHNYQIVNMREATSYTFPVIEGSRRFKVFFGDEATVKANMLPESIAVGEAFPNPMRDQFTIPVSLPNSGNKHALTVEIYNISGQLIKRIDHENVPAGYHRVQWDRTDTDGEHVRSGLYFYRLKVNDQLYDGRVITW